MSVAGFLADPKGYLGTHAAYVYGNSPVTNVALTQAAGPPLGNGFTSRSYTPVAGQYLTLGFFGVHNATGLLGNIGRKVGVLGRLRRDFQVIASGADVGFRYLPDQEGYCTYMQIDAGATFVLTGPLTGCTVAVVRAPGGALWFFHSFRPAGTAVGVVQANQQTAINSIAAALMVVNPIQFCRFGHEYNGMGFVFGRRRAGGVWKFYAHATGIVGGANVTATQKFAEL